MSERVVFKYPVEPAAMEPDGLEIEVPVGAEFLDVQTQGEGNAVMWWLVNPVAPTEPRRFWVIGTGRAVPPVSFYVGTFQAGWFVGHVLTDRPFASARSVGDGERNEK